MVARGVGKAVRKAAKHTAGEVAYNVDDAGWAAKYAASTFGRSWREAEQHKAASDALQKLRTYNVDAKERRPQAKKGTLRFNPKAKLDASQVTDSRLGERVKKVR